MVNYRQLVYYQSAIKMTLCTSKNSTRYVKLLLPQKQQNYRTEQNST